MKIMIYCFLSETQIISYFYRLDNFFMQIVNFKNFEQLIIKVG